MGIGADKLTYDPTDADSLAASSTVGAYTLDASGVGITSTAGSGPYAGKQGLDVSLISPISVATDIVGIYDVSTNPLPDTVGSIFHTRSAAPSEVEQVERTTAGSPTADNIVAANVHGIDANTFLHGFDGTTWDRLTATGGKLDVNIGAAVITVTDAALANTAALSTAVAPSTTATNFPAALASRKYLTFQNLNGNCFVGGSTVTASTGLRLAAGAMLEGLRIGPAITLKHVMASGTGDLRILELS